MIDSEIPPFNVYPKEMKIYAHIYLVHEYSWSIINNNPKEELIQVSISWWADKWNVSYPYNRIFSGNKNKYWSNVDKPYKTYAKWKKHNITDHILYDSIHKTVKSLETERSVIARAWEKRGMGVKGLFWQW